MKIEIYKTEGKEYSWRLMVNGNEIARMPDGTGSPWKVKRSMRAFMKHAGGDASEIGRAVAQGLAEFEREHPTAQPKIT